MPKQPLKKLWELAAHYRPDAKEKRRDLYSQAQIDELLQASQDLQDMKNCYDNLLSASAAAANSAYDFSESLRELGTCLLDKTAVNDDEESGRAVLMLGKLQFELQRLVDCYRAHITQTISTPSDSLLNELRTVEEMKRQCDDKRAVYEHMVATQSEKGRPKSSKEVRDAQQEYEEEATLFVFRLKSLKQGQSRSLLTQAARHYSAQLSLFRKGLKALEMAEPHVRRIAEQHHIDYQFSGLQEDYETDNENDAINNDDANDADDDGDLNFDYGRSSVELDTADLSSAAVSTVDKAPESQLDLLPARRPRAGSKSGPISDLADQLLTSSAKRFHTYVLPTPIDLGCSTSPPHRKAATDTPPLLRLAPSSDPTKFKRQAFSGPLPSKGKLIPPRVPTPPPRELPRPPPVLSAGRVGHSAPLVSRAPLLSAKMASPLPRPPAVMSRSFSIPSSRQRSSLNALPLTSSPLVRPMTLTSPVRVRGLVDRRPY